MASYRDLLQGLRAEIDEIQPPEAAARADAPVFVDVREQDEWDVERIPGALHLTRGRLESRIERAVPDKEAPIVVYCESGTARSSPPERSRNSATRKCRTSQAGSSSGSARGCRLATGSGAHARTAAPLQPAHPDSRGRRGGAAEAPRLADPPHRRGWPRLPASLYLAAAGVGTLGIVDADVVDETNLQRQIVHSTARLGEAKVRSAADTITALNPDVKVDAFEERLTSENADRIIGAGWDVIVDGADNFPTRYLVNDASVWHNIPVVHGSIYRFEGQATVFKPNEGPCYRCLFPQPPPPELAPSCAEGGVLGVLPGVIGSLQANEALKLALGIGSPLIGRLLLFDALTATFDEVALRRDPSCPVCGESPTITEYVDYVEFCAGPARQT